MSEKFSKKEQQKEKLLPDYLEEAKKLKKSWIQWKIPGLMTMR